ncbi:MAG: C4-dicarboxylate transport system permease small protein [Clostridiales bacterium]|nr:C4-dicarboxylate transport system permease small protein [Clostridiales bacterium]
MIKIINKAYDSIATICLFGTLVCVVMQVFTRYVLNVSVPWTEELARYFLAACVFLGAGIASRKGEHLGAFFIRDQMKGRVKGIILIFNNLLCLLVQCFIIYGSLKMAKMVYENSAVTMPVVSQAWQYVLLIVGTVVMIIYTIRDIYLSVRVLKTGNTDGHLREKSTPFPIEVD